MSILLYFKQLTSFVGFFYWIANRPSASQNIPSHLRTRVSLPCSWQPTSLPILNQRNPVQVFLPYFFYIHVNIIPHLRLELTSGLFVPPTRFSSLSCLPKFLSLIVYLSPNGRNVTKSMGWYECGRRYGGSENCVSSLVGQHWWNMPRGRPIYEGWNFNSDNYLFTTDTK